METILKISEKRPPIFGEFFDRGKKRNYDGRNYSFSPSPMPRLFRISPIVPVLLVTAFAASCSVRSPFSTDRSSDDRSSAASRRSAESVVAEESPEFLEGARKVDYAPTFSGFALAPFETGSSATFSGGVLMVGKSSFTGSLVRLQGVEIGPDGKGGWTCRSEASFVPPESQSGASAVAVPLKTAPAIFVPGFSKMRLLGKTYAYAPENLSAYGNVFDIDAFVTADGTAYVLEFENAKEKASRKETLDEYERKVREVKERYPADPAVANRLIDALNDAYGIDATKF